jgi:AraC-like DNA-binding protein
MVQPGQPTITVARPLKEWLSSTETHLVPSGANGHEAGLNGQRFSGEAVSLLQLEAQGLTKILVRNHADQISFGIGDHGQCRGTAAGREFRLIPKRIGFILMPREVLALQVGSPRIGGLVIQLPVARLLEECSLHEIEDPDLLTLEDTIPGHEGLLLACAQQLLDLAGQPESPARARMVMPLEASILSLLASLVGSHRARRSSSTGLSSEQPQMGHVQTALAYLEANLSEPITLTDLCKACSISARTLQMAFQTVMNRTPLQVLQEMRLTRLRQLLQQRMDVRSACTQTGLQPTGRMAASYKRLFGELPRQTRLHASE